MAYEKLKQEHYRNLGGIDTYNSKYQTEDTKFLDLRNWCFERPGALVSRPGIEYHLTLNTGSYAVKPDTTAQFVQSSGSFFVFNSGDKLLRYNGGYSLIGQSLGTSFLPDFESTRNILYWTNSQQFVRFNGSALENYELGFAGGSIVGMSFNVSLIAGPTAVIASGTWAISYQLARGYTSINEGPYYGVQYANTKTASSVTASPLLFLGIGATIASRGRWIAWTDQTISPGQTLGAIPFLIKTSAGITNFVSGTAAPFYYTTVAGTTYLHFEFDHFTQDTDQDLSKNYFGTPPAVSGIYVPYAPKFLATYNNILFIAGGTVSRDVIWYSEPAEPENVQPDNFFKVESKKMDDITGLAVFQDALIIGKAQSMWELSGLEPSSFQLRELTNEYGLINNRAFAIFENRFWFADSSGIVEYDGSNFKRISNEIDSLLAGVDKTTLFAVHLKKRRQVWFCSSSLCFIYDYSLSAWTIYDRAAIDSNAGALLAGYGATRSDVSWWTTGSSFHQFSRFNDSLSADYGVAITLLAQTKFHKRLEQTTQELWRRSYVNVVAGSTQGVTMQLLPDYGTSVYAERSVYADTFQKRIEYGISARSLSIKFIISASQPIKLNGYAIESKFLRKV